MTRERIERLRDYAIAMAKEHEAGGFCSCDPCFNVNTLKEEPQVHILENEFCKTFANWEVEYHDEECDKLFVMVDGVKFFTLKDK